MLGTHFGWVPECWEFSGKVRKLKLSFWAIGNMTKKSRDVNFDKPIITSAVSKKRESQVFIPPKQALPL